MIPSGTPLCFAWPFLVETEMPRKASLPQSATGLGTKRIPVRSLASERSGREGGSAWDFDTGLTYKQVNSTDSV